MNFMFEWQEQHLTSERSMNFTSDVFSSKLTRVYMINIAYLLRKGRFVFTRLVFK